MGSEKVSQLPFSGLCDGVNAPVHVTTRCRVEGIRKSTLALKASFVLCKLAGHVGTLGPGYNCMGSLHVKDCSSALLLMLKTGVEGNGDTGAEGTCAFR